MPTPTGYDYAGVQAGDECHCGNGKPGDDKKTADNECATPCKTRNYETCGGTERANVYDLTYNFGK